MQEATLNVNSIGENEYLKDGRGKWAQIYRLICMIPGTDRLNPEKGVDIRRYYYKVDRPDTYLELQELISDQIKRYTPYTTTNVLCRKKVMKDKTVILSITIYIQDSDEVLVVVTDGENSDFDTFKNT